MKLTRGARLSVSALLAHRGRTLLAVASIAVGAAAVLVTGAIGTGAEREIVGRIEAMGTNLLIVRPAQVKRLAARATIRGAVTSLVPEDVEAIGALASVVGAAPAAETAARVKAGTASMLATVRGTSPAYLAVRRLRVEDGRFLAPGDDDSSRRVAVLGARVARTLFPDAAVLGREIRVSGVPFDVVGVLPSRGVLADGSDEDNQVLVPIRTAMRRVLNRTWLNSVFVAVRSADRMPEAAADIRVLLRDRHQRRSGGGDDDFEVQDSTRYLQMQQRAADSLQRLSGGLGVLALLMGGTGILALMFLSVKERTTEIGLRMAVGARPRDVFAQFVLEAILLALGGWTAGVAVAALGAAAVALGTSWPVGLPVTALVASLGMAVTIGTGAGALPARRASLVPPIKALLAR
jgi:putative ABC transport system permease protein